MKRAGGSAKLLQEQGGRMNRVEKTVRGGGWGVDGKVKAVMCVMRTEVQGPGQVNHIRSNWPVQGLWLLF